MPVVSPDGKRVAYFSTRGGMGVWVMNADGSAARRLAPGVAQGHGGWTHDNRHVVVFRPDGDSAGIYTVDIESARVRRILAETNVRSVAVSPDGKRLVYSYSRPPNIMLATVEIDGSRRRTITGEPGRSFGGSWSPDASTLVYTKLGSGIWTMRADGSEARQVVAEGSGPTWSPDGEWIAYVVTRMGALQPGQRWAQPERGDIVLVRPDGRDRRVLTKQTEDLVLETPSWFPDGKRIAVQVIHDGITSLNVLGLNGRLEKPIGAK